MDFLYANWGFGVQNEGSNVSTGNYEGNLYSWIQFYTTLDTLESVVINSRIEISFKSPAFSNKTMLNLFFLKLRHTSCFLMCSLHRDVHCQRTYLDCTVRFTDLDELKICNGGLVLVLGQFLLLLQLPQKKTMLALKEVEIDSNIIILLC